MTRLILRAAAVLIGLFAACIALIHAQPYDDSQLRAFFTPAVNCPHPCFMGIRPGVTTVEEAMAILEAHDWIAGVNRYEATDGRGVTSLTAAWSGAQSDFIDDSEELWMGVEDNIVQGVFVSTRIPLARIWLLFGVPEYSGVSERPIPETTRPSAGFYAVHFDMDSVFVFGDFCPIEFVWNEPVEWILWPDLSASNTPVRDDLPVEVYSACRRAMSNP
jgi:hypothetical protein